MSFFPSSVLSQVAIAFNPNTIIVYNVSTNNTKSSGNITIDLEGKTMKYSQFFSVLT